MYRKLLNKTAFQSIVKQNPMPSFFSVSAVRLSVNWYQESIKQRNGELATSFQMYSPLEQTSKCFINDIIITTFILWTIQSRGWFHEDDLNQTKEVLKKKDGTENFISFNLDPGTGEDLLHNLKLSASMRGQKKKKKKMLTNARSRSRRVMSKNLKANSKIIWKPVQRGWNKGLCDPFFFFFF